MSNVQNIPPHANMLVFPGEPTPGALAVFAKYEKLNEIRELEQERQERLWEVRAVVSDHVPLAGGADDVELRASHHLFYLNENPIWIYLHSGGRNAVYYELVGDEAGKLKHIAVRVAARLPSNALLLARKPVNALLDVFTRDYDMPLIIVRLELMSPRDGAVLLTQMLLPHRNGIRFGPLGGILQAVPFAPYDALYREALTSSSPFYRLLCAWKIYEGAQRLRRWIREQCEQRNITQKMPSDPPVDPDELIRMGLDAKFVVGIKRTGDLFERMAKARHAIAHFLIDKDDQEASVYLADGSLFQLYATGSAALLRYAHKLLESLRIFCVQNGVPLGQGQAMIMPTPENRNEFIVRARDYGVE